jgi:hypothetical protein
MSPSLRIIPSKGTKTASAPRNSITIATEAEAEHRRLAKNWPKNNTPKKRTKQQQQQPASKPQHMTETKHKKKRKKKMKKKKTQNK